MKSFNEPQLEIHQIQNSNVIATSLPPTSFDIDHGGIHVTEGNWNMNN